MVLVADAFLTRIVNSIQAVVVVQKRNTLGVPALRDQIGRMGQHSTGRRASLMHRIRCQAIKEKPRRLAAFSMSSVASMASAIPCPAISDEH